MLKWNDYRKKTVEEWKKVRVRTVKELQNGGGFKIPAGTIVRIVDKRGGFSIEPENDFNHLITRVPPYSLELL